MEYSDRGKPNDYYVNRISEEEFESERERRSSPPGTIGDNLNCLVVRERIPLPNDNKHVLSFKKVYDRLFKDFKDKLV